MPTPTEAAKAIVREWANWADRGMYIANGMIDPKALARLEASIATSLVSAEAPLRETLETMAAKLQKADEAIGNLSRTHMVEADAPKPKPKRKPRESAE